MKEFVKRVLSEIVDKPDELKINLSLNEAAGDYIINVEAAESDVGKLIGKQGRNAEALRIIFRAVAAKEKRRVIFEVQR